MTKIKILALVVGMMLLFVVPATVSAGQPQLPHVFVGTADGAEVTAWVDDAQVASGAITDGSYNVTVDPGESSWGDKAVSFKIDGNNAAETATFVHGGADELNLTAAPAEVAEAEVAEGEVAEGEVAEAAVAPAAVAPAAGAVTLILYEENDSGQNGSAVLTPVGTQTEVVLDLSYGKRRSGPVNIHLGSCGVNLGGVEYELTPFVGQGGSTTMVDATLESLQDGNHVINADYELSFLHAKTVDTSCANIPKAGGQQRVSGSAYVGTNGANGINGINGRDGRDGVDGLNGTNGADGPRGASGSAGAAGAAGAAGDSGSNILGIISIILAAIAIVAAAGLLMTRKKGATG